MITRAADRMTYDQIISNMFEFLEIKQYIDYYSNVIIVTMSHRYICTIFWKWKE